MSIAGYQLTIDPKRFAKLNRELAAKLVDSGGEPLVPTSSSRAFMSLDVLKSLRGAMSGGEIDKTLSKYGAEWGDQVDDQLAVALLRTRDSSDLPPREPLEQDPVPDPQSGEFLDWHLVEANINGAWKLFGGRDRIDWGSVCVGHIDTGFTCHPALGFKKGSAVSPWVDTVRDRNCFSKEIANAAAGNSPPGTSVSTFDAQDTLGGMSGGHGPRTASLLSGFDTGAAARRAARAGMSYSGFFGAAPKVPLVPIRVEDTVWIQNELGAGLPDAIDYLVESVGVGVISLSMGSPKFFLSGPGVPARLDEALRNAYARGVIVVCAAGNHIPNEQVVFPARLPRTIAVGGSTPGSLPWSGSSYGVQVDISAPAYPMRRATTERGDKFIYGVGDGTSFATPLVAGTAALWLARHGGAIDAKYPKKWQRVAAFLSLLKSTARVPPNWPAGTRGDGILDAGKLVAAALPEPDPLTEDTQGTD
jgi:subtilisin family serine protease